VAAMAKISLALIALSVLILLPIQAYTHVEEEGEEAEEILILSRYMKGNIEFVTDPESEQWEESFEKDIESMWEHEISIKTLNNGTHVFFLLSWYDPTKVAEDLVEEADGASIIFEITKAEEREEKEHEEEAETKAEEATVEEVEDVWYWSTSKIEDLRNEGIITKAEWGDEQWNVLIGRQISLDTEDIVSFKTGVREEGFVKFVVWDGAKGESFEQIEDEELLHADFILLPEIDVYPKDVYVWSGILGAGAILFVFLETRLHRLKEAL